MNDFTHLLNALELDDQDAQNELLGFLHQELHRMAQAKMRSEPVDCTLQTTALVNEAYIRLLGNPEDENWDNRGHFFAAASEVMRRVLVDAARRRKAAKRGGALQRRELPEIAAEPRESAELLAIHEALCKLETINSEAAQVVSLRYFSGMTIPEVAAILEISPRKVNQVWAYAKAWLAAELES